MTPDAGVSPLLTANAGVAQLSRIVPLFLAYPLTFQYSMFVQGSITSLQSQHKFLKRLFILHSKSFDMVIPHSPAKVFYMVVFRSKNYLFN